MRQILYFLHQHNKITKTFYNILSQYNNESDHCNNKLVIMTGLKSIHINLPKDVETN